MSDCVNIWTLLSNDAPHLFQLCNNSNASIEAIHAIEFSARSRHNPVLVHNDNERNIVANCHFKVVWIVSCSYFDRTCSEIRIYKFIGNDRDHAVNKRQKYFSANHMLIARIIWVHGNCAIAHHCLGASCCDNDTLVTIAITNLNKFACIILVFYFNI